MPYVGGTLEPLFGELPTHKLLRSMADRGGDKLKEWVVRNTPIGGGGSLDPFHGHDVPGRLRASWYREPVDRRMGSRGRTEYVARVATDVDYAPHVEWGTGLWGPSHARYEIKPKRPGGWLHWIDPKTGDDVFAKRVMHPGSPGAHMMAIATQMLEAEHEHLFDDLLERWVREMEALARA